MTPNLTLQFEDWLRRLHVCILSPEAIHCERFFSVGILLKELMSSPLPRPAVEQLIGQSVVLDVASMYVYLGTLTAVDERYLVLTETDVHDLRDTTTTRELYVLDSKRHGISVNRRRVLVNRDEVVSLSALADVVE